MGLRGCVDAWGVAVKREGFTRPPLVEPAPIKRASNNSAAPIKRASPEPAPLPVQSPEPAPSSVAPRGRGRPKQAESDKPWIAAGISRRTWYNRQKAKAKDKA